MTYIETIFSELLSFDFDLQLFAEGSGASGDTGASGGEMGENAADAMPQIGEGENSSDEAEADAEKTVEARRAAFQSRIKGEDKDFFGEEVDRIVKERLRGTRAAVRNFETARPIIEEAAKKYGLDPGDIAGIRAAFDNDDERFESESFKTGKPVGQLKAEQKAERAAKELAAYKRQEATNRQYGEWIKQGEALAKKYPGVDIAAELRNPQIQSLLRNHIDLEAAYLVVHKDEIIPSLMQHVAKDVEEKISRKQASNASRPTENGVGANSAVSTKKSVSQMTKAERADIAQRVARGERIIL